MIRTLMLENHRCLLRSLINCFLVEYYPYFPKKDLNIWGPKSHLELLNLLPMKSSSTPHQKSYFLSRLSMEI